MSRLRIVVLIAGVLYTILLAAITLSPEPVDAPYGQQIGFIVATVRRLGWSTFGYAHLQGLSNVALFVPFGVIAGVLFRVRDWWVGIVLGVVSSAFIETAQFLFFRNRFATLDDVVTNSIGTVIGVAIGVVAHVVQRRREKRRLASALS
ncbi:VanZ family protein [Microbacteriaceae bacterium VKM Ac-2855]|nr:VanZ family protein [Microbacteriaceae bacterium VKM Ac-2855]